MVGRLHVATAGIVVEEWLRLSASQVQTFRDCQRKWAWKYIAGIEEAPGPGAVLGRSVHEVLEKYLLSGEIDFTTEVGYIAASGIEHLPKPGTPGMRVEEEFHFVGPSGHSYLGYKDVELAGVVIDHKTTSDFRWQKTEQDLRSDVQATLYAVDYFKNHPDEDEVELRWVYYLTRNTRKSAVTRLRMSQEQAWNNFLGIEETARTMADAAAVASTKSPLELPPNVDHCSAFGGCPHQGRCNLSPFDKLRSYVSQNSLLAKLNAQKNGTVNGAVPPGVIPSGVIPSGVPAPVVPAAVPASTNALLARMQAAGAPAATQLPTAPPAVVVPSTAVAAPLAVVAPPIAAPVVTGPAVNPPEWQPPPASPTVAVPDVAPVAAASAVPMVALPVAVMPSVAVPAAAVSAALPAPARGRGRPRKAADPALVAAQQAALGGQSNPFADPAVGTAASTHVIEMLFLDCGPVGVAVRDANEFIMAAKRRIATQQIDDGRGGKTYLTDYRFAPYGQGPGMLALSVAAELDALGPMGLWVRLDTSTPEGSIVASELTARAAVVVR